MRRFWGVGVIALALGAVVLVWGAGRGWFEAERKQVAIDTDKMNSSESGSESNFESGEREIPAGHVSVGGAIRPLSDVKKIAPKDFSLRTKRLSPGVVPRVNKTANAYTKSVAEAVGNPKLGHRLSALIPPPPFDLEAYEADPEKYLTTVEPGRFRQFLPKSDDVTSIKRASRYFSKVLQGEKVVFQAKVAPKMPVTFYSPRLGQFENQLGTITVAANEEGIARAEFEVSSGTRGNIEVFAASPVHSGQLRFFVTVVLPEKTVTAPVENSNGNG